MPQFFKNRGNLFPLLLVGVLLLYGTPAFAEQEPKFETVSLGQAVLLFRLAAQDDYPAALKKYVNEGTQEYFKTLDAALWPVTDPAKGWAFFFNTCVIAFGKKISSGQVPVTFYHPWSDVFLLTVWRVDNKLRLPAIPKCMKQGKLRQRQQFAVPTPSNWTMLYLQKPRLHLGARLRIAHWVFQLLRARP